MKIYEPTDKEVFRELKRIGCTWAYGQGCECHIGIKKQGCFDKIKRQLTQKELTCEEIEADKAINKNAMKELKKFLCFD